MIIECQTPHATQRDAHTQEALHLPSGMAMTHSECESDGNLKFLTRWQLSISNKNRPNLRILVDLDPRLCVLFANHMTNSSADFACFLSTTALLQDIFEPITADNCVPFFASLSHSQLSCKVITPVPVSTLALTLIPLSNLSHQAILCFSWALHLLSCVSQEGKPQRRFDCRCLLGFWHARLAPVWHLLNDTRGHGGPNQPT